MQMPPAMRNGGQPPSAGCQWARRHRSEGADRHVHPTRSLEQNLAANQVVAARDSFRPCLRRHGQGKSNFRPLASTTASPQTLVLFVIIKSLARGRRDDPDPQVTAPIRPHGPDLGEDTLLSHPTLGQPLLIVCVRTAMLGAERGNPSAAAAQRDEARRDRTGQVQRHVFRAPEQATEGPVGGHRISRSWAGACGRLEIVSESVAMVVHGAP
jgi:hypothetical protein